MNPFNFFSKIFYINLDHRTDRNLSISEQFMKYDIQAERFSAIRISEQESELLTANGYPLCEKVSDDDKEHKERIKKVTLGQRSCLFSHLKIIQYAKDNNLDNVLIFEDDAVFNMEIDVKDVLFKTLEELKKNKWDMFYLGCIPLSELSHQGEFLRKMGHFSTTTAYAVNKSCYEILLDFPFKHEMNIDVHFSKLSGMMGKINVYTPKFPLVYQTEDFSDIQMRNVGGLEQYIKPAYSHWLK